MAIKCSGVWLRRRLIRSSSKFIRLIYSIDLRSFVVILFFSKKTEAFSTFIRVRNASKSNSYSSDWFVGMVTILNIAIPFDILSAAGRYSCLLKPADIFVSHLLLSAVYVKIKKNRLEHSDSLCNINKWGKFLKKLWNCFVVNGWRIFLLLSRSYRKAFLNTKKNRKKILAEKRVFLHN